MVYCHNCKTRLDDDALLCPHCHADLNQASRRPTPQDERLKRIIRDFEMKTDIIYKPAPGPRIYQSGGIYRPSVSEPLARGVLTFNIILSMLLPPVGIVRSIIFLANIQRTIKDLWLMALIISLASAAVQVFLVISAFN